MPPLNRYRYSPLETDDAIRLLILDAAPDPEDPLSGSLAQHAAITEALDYWAISYVWGEQDFHHTLELREEDGDISYLKITSSVNTVLKRFRNSHTPQNLWIDAICLNQDDETEKAHQVPVMGRIYEKAGGVHIWLGAEDKHTASIFGFLHEAPYVPDRGDEESELELLRLMTKYLPRKSNPYAEFSFRPWFLRRWIVQEAWLARQATFYCGRYSISLPTYVRAIHRLQSAKLFDYSTNMVSRLGRPTARVDMLELLYRFHAGNCLDRRDRIAALYGLVPKSSRFQMDYSVHWTEMYKHVATFALTTGTNDTRLQLLLHLFEFGPISDPSLDLLYPSWVPNWSETRRRILPFHYARLFVDVDDDYPTQVGYPSVSVLTFQHNALRIHWHPALAGPKARSVTQVWHISFTEKEDRASLILDILRELFPPKKSMVPHLLVFCSLVDTLAQFYYLKPFKDYYDYRIETESFDHYLKYLRRKLPVTVDPQVLESLRYLGTILMSLCLFVLDPVPGAPGAHRSYGFGSLRVREGDVMVPVWRPKSDSEHPVVDERARNFMTMLVVRCEVGGQGDELRGRVIGPAVCCTAPDGTLDAEGGLGLDERSETPGDGWHSLWLI